MKRLDIAWRGSFRVDDIDEERVRLLKEGNCKVIGLGLESADNAILKSMRKNITIEQIEKALKIVYDAEVPFSGNFLFGDIAETVQTATNTFNWWLEHDQYNINLWMVVSYPGSYLYQYACEKNIITDRVKYLKEGCPAVNVSKLAKEEMSWLVKNLLEMPFKKAKDIEDVAVLSTSPERKRMTIAGNCVHCGAHNTWDDIKPFLSVNLTCKKCAQKHNIPFPAELQKSVAHCVQELLNTYKKIAVWGVTSYSASLFKEFPVFQDPRIVAVDNASAKQMMDLYGQSVYAPAAIGEQNVPAVVVFYPNSIQQISAHLKDMYPCVEKIFDICDLIHHTEIQAS